MESKNILILGANSFSGNSFESYARKDYDKVIGLGRSGLPLGVFDSASLVRAEKNYTFVNFDLNKDLKAILELIEEEKINFIVNFAAQSMVAQSWETPEDWYEANVLSLAKLTKHLVKNSTIEKFIQFTTPEVYGSTHGWIEESFNFAPNTPYAVSRAAADWHLKALHENFGFPVIFTRAANVFGKHQQLYRIVPRAILSSMTGKTLPLQGGGKSIRSFIHINDVSDALMKILDKGRIGQSYHISTNRLVSIHELVSMIAIKVGVELNDLIEITPDRAGKDFAYQLNSNKIRGELGWKDRISLEDGIAETVEWVRENLDELKCLPTEYVHRK